jgi:putative flippase GtrA
MDARRTGQIFSYLAIGSATALTYICVCTWLTGVGFSPGQASVAGYLLVIPPAYFGQKIVTFRSPAWHRIAFPKYLALQVTGNAAGYFISEQLAHTGAPLWTVFGAVAVMVAAMNFFALKYWAFRVHA